MILMTTKTDFNKLLLTNTTITIKDKEVLKEPKPITKESTNATVKVLRSSIQTYITVSLLLVIELSMIMV